MKKISGIFLFSCLLIAGLSAVIQAAEAPTLENIEFTAPAANIERITFKLNGTYIPKIFAIKGEKPRVVFDFPKTRIAKTLNNIIHTNGTFIKQIRVGLHEGKKPKTRVVLDLVADREIDFSQNFDKKKNALTVSVYYAGTTPAELKASAGKASTTAQNAPKKEVTPTQTTAKPAQAQAPATPAPKQPAASVAAAGSETAGLARMPDTPDKKQAVNVGSSPKKSTPAVKPEKKATTGPKEALPAKSTTPADNHPQAEKDGVPILRAVTFDNTSNRGEMIQFKLSTFHPPIVFGIEEGLPRVVCDFKNTRMGSSLKNTIKTKGRYVKAIRIGRHTHPEKIRVVIDLEPNNNYDLQQVYFKEDNLFVIIVNTMHNTPPVEELKKPLVK